MTDRSAIVVGGGLAGMVVARELALRRRLALAPVIAWLEEECSPHRPDASHVRREGNSEAQV